MTDAEKCEKVVRGLECCIVRDPDAKSNCVECPYNHEGIITNAPCANGLMADALSLLKEQEARVMTYEEIKDNLGVPVWVEYADDENWNGYGVPTSDYKAYIMIYGANDFCAHYARSHNVKWRCWTSRPSEQQMRDTPWEREEESK